MQITEHVAQLLRPLDNVLLTLGAACFERLVQGVALDVIHDDEEASVAVDNIDNTGQIRVIEALQQFRFHDKVLLYDLIILNAVLADLLDRPDLVCFFVDSLIDNAHAALSDDAKDPVLAVYE